MTRPQQLEHPVEIIPADLLLYAYCNAMFPMAESREGPLYWYSPDPRAIIPLDGLKVSRSLRQLVKKRVFDVRVNTVFESVIRECAEREETWISEQIVQSYLELHRLGYAHSVETWRNEKLVGGLYGVAVGGAFFGESMFHTERDASKVALVFLVDRLREREFELLDTQFITPHLARLGAIEISKDEYVERLKHAIKRKRSFL
jgi:leucyl/phenylalanyl-tRNA--protein transferase